MTVSIIRACLYRDKRDDKATIKDSYNFADSYTQIRVSCGPFRAETGNAVMNINTITDPADDRLPQVNIDMNINMNTNTSISLSLSLRKLVYWWCLVMSCHVMWSPALESPDLISFYHIM